MKMDYFDPGINQNEKVLVHLTDYYLILNWLNSDSFIHLNYILFRFKYTHFS